jgi:hypothetical protein
VISAFPELIVVIILSIPDFVSTTVRSETLKIHRVAVDSRNLEIAYFEDMLICTFELFTFTPRLEE